MTGAARGSGLRIVNYLAADKAKLTTVSLEYMPCMNDQQLCMDQTGIMASLLQANQVQYKWMADGKRIKLAKQ